MIEKQLSRFKYNAEYFKVTDLMKELELQGQDVDDSSTNSRYDTYIKYANKLRERTQHNNILAILSTRAISQFRERQGKEFIPRQAYIFDQYKRPEEIVLLRQTYAQLFILVSLYSSKEKRVKYLSQRFSEDESISKQNADHDQKALALIDRDQDEQEQPHGQRLSDTFSLGDLFLDIDDEVGSEKLLGRFLDALFGSNKISPTKDEYGMQIAKTASLRSLDLSRQVGAAIFSTDGEVVTLGSNEVPKAGGGTYWCGDDPDARDYDSEGDENERIKRAIFADVIRRLDKAKLIDKTAFNGLEQVIKFVVAETSRKGSPLKEAQVMDLLEYGRIIHAEMSAITDAARLGRSIKGAVLYCTTFPCHMCAKHIVSAGISRVLYVEPYPKSYAEQLHSDSISVDMTNPQSGKVHFSPFIGISPVRFKDLFSRSRRKNTSGKFSEWMEEIPTPIIKYTVATYLKNEEALNAMFLKVLKSDHVAPFVKLRPAS